MGLGSKKQARFLKGAGSMKVKVWMLAAVVVSCASFVVAIDPENFCDTVATPDACQDDRLNIRFSGGATLVSELTDVKANDEIPVKITIDVVTAKISGFSYGVKHDSAFLTMPQPAETEPTCDRAGTGTGDLSGCNPTISGTTALVESANVGGWNTTALAEGPNGFYSAVIFSMMKAKELPTAQTDYPICVVKYKCTAEPTSAGTKIFFTNELNPPGSPPVTVNLTTGGKSKQPKTVQNALAKGAAGPQGCTLTKDVAFYFGDKATTDAFAMSGNTCAVGLRNKGVKGLGFSMGIQRTGTNLAFVSTLGSPVVDLVFTKEDGTEVAGDVLKGNTATGAPTDGIAKIERSAVLAANDPGDFLGVTIDGSGAWATVGYVSDVSGSRKVIDVVSDPANGCGIQQILTITFGSAPTPKFSRGDANGDGKINVTDGVIIAQNIFASKLVFFDCKDMLDANDDGQLNTVDPVFLLQYIFLKGATPAAPFKTCGVDPTNDTLDCKVANNCP